MKKFLVHPVYRTPMQNQTVRAIPFSDVDTVILMLTCILMWLLSTGSTHSQDDLTIEAYPVPARSLPHDVAPAPDGTVWYTTQHSGELGILDPETGETRHISLGRGAVPHGVIVELDDAAWITDSGLNAIIRVNTTTDNCSYLRISANACACDQWNGLCTIIVLHGLQRR